MHEVPFKAFDFHGFGGKRRTVSYGWKYDFDTERVLKGEDMPPLLLSVPKIAGRIAGVDSPRLNDAFPVVGRHLAGRRARRSHFGGFLYVHKTVAG